MKERIKQSGSTLYDEQIKDAQDILAYGFQDDVSYNPNIVTYRTDDKIPIKMYDQKYSATYGITAKFLSPHEYPIELGQLLYDNKKNAYWLCVESYDVSGIHCEGKLGKCGRFLKWQDENGVIKETPMIVTSAAKYNNGEEGSAVIKLGSDQLMLFMQLNEDTVKLDREMKFFIDENKSNPSVYELTRTDTALYTYMGIGFLSIVVTECAYTPTDKELELGVCNYKEPSTPTPPTPPQPSEPDKTTDLKTTISGNKELKVGFSRTYTVTFVDEKTGSKVDWNDVEFTWHVVSAFDVSQNAYDNKIELIVSDESLVGLSFLLCIQVDEVIVEQIEINIVEGW